MNYQRIIKDIKSVVKKSCHNKNLSNYFIDFANKNIFIYGAGNTGKYVCDILENNHFMIHSFLDIRGDSFGNYHGIPIKTLKSIDLTDSETKNSIVILCVLSDNEIEKSIVDNLQKSGFKSIIPFKQKAFSNDFIIKRNPIYSEPTLRDYEDEIVSCIHLFSDIGSIDTYKNNITAFASRDFAYLPFITNEAQYFPADIEFSKGYSSFVDCGAYDGDTILNLIRFKGIPHAVFAFEPDMLNFSVLTNKLEQINIKNCCLFPCGVSSMTRTFRFSSDTVYSGAASSIDQNGDTIIQCVALDDVLKNIAPTFIKMDIEGAEYEALLGAKNIISKNQPDLAISVYHYLDHYFEIPMLIDSWNLGYKFYLRTYDSGGKETILYATGER